MDNKHFIYGSVLVIFIVAMYCLIDRYIQMKIFLEIKEQEKYLQGYSDGVVASQQIQPQKIETVLTAPVQNRALAETVSYTVISDNGFLKSIGF